MDDTVPTLWLIPARGGSKGIPDKNIKPFCGKSLVARAIEQALSLAGTKDTVFVSTDSSRIKVEAEKCGLQLPFLRPPHLASDSASTYDTIIHTLQKFRENGMEFQRVVLLQPTSPFRTSEDIQGALRLWHADLDMVVSVTKSNSNPYYNLFETDSTGFLKISKGDGKYTRRQDVPPVWEYNGAVYVMTVSSLLEMPMSALKKIIPYEMPAKRSIDLDTPEDWAIAEILYKNTLQDC